MLSRLRIVLIGVGRRGAGAHLPVITRLDDVYELVALCDKDGEAVQRHAAPLGVRAYTSVRELVQRERFDVADLVVPADAHHAVALFLMQHGIHVLVETPIAPTLGLADMMIDGARRHGVKIEVAENYYRAPIERIKARAIDAGLIGEVSRLYRLFHEGGYHGMSILRTHARGNPVSVIGLSHRSPVVPIVDRMQRRHEQEDFSLGAITFDNGVLALQMYSNVIHARSLGRGQQGIDQIDGSRGTIVDDTVHVVPAERLLSGAVSTPVRPERQMREVAGVAVLEALRLPGTGVEWTNPLVRYPVTERQIAVADELLSIARAVKENADPEYGARRGRLDQEMNLAIGESGRAGHTAVRLPLTDPTAQEAQTLAAYRTAYGCDATDVDALVDTFFPRV